MSARYKITVYSGQEKVKLYFPDIHVCIHCMPQTQRRRKDLKVAPSLLYIHKAASENYSPVIQMGEAKKREDVNNFSIHENEFRKNLTITLEEIFNPETSFSQTSVEDKCQYCDYKDLCKK